MMFENAATFHVRRAEEERAIAGTEGADPAAAFRLRLAQLHEMAAGVEALTLPAER